jgi:hypothetical protein
MYRVATVHGTIGRGVRPYYHEFGFFLLGKRDDCRRIHSDKWKTEIGSEGKMQPFRSSERLLIVFSNDSNRAFTFGLGHAAVGAIALAHAFARLYNPKWLATTTSSLSDANWASSSVLNPCMWHVRIKVPSVSKK